MRTTFRTVAICVSLTLASAAHAADKGAAFTDAFSFNGHFSDYLETNPDSGANAGKWGNTAQLELGTDVDLDQLAGWTGGILHVKESIFGLKRNAVFNPVSGGHFFAQDISSTLGGAPFPNFIPSSYLSELSIQQQLGHGFEVQAGRMNPVMYFDVPTNCESTLSCQNPITLYDNLTLPPAFATWGGRLAYHPSKADTFQAGVFEDNFGSNLTTGFDWSTKGSSGVFLATEYSHHEDFQDARFPTSETIGLWHDTPSFSDPASGTVQQGSTGIYLRGQRTLWRDDGSVFKSAPGQYLNGFATAGFSFDDAQPYRAYAEVGTNFHGPFGVAPENFIGLKIAYLRVNENELEAERAKRLANTGIDFLSAKDQFRAELNGHIALEHGATLEPSVEYVWNPNTQFSNGSASDKAPKSGIVLGAVFSVSFGGSPK